MLQPSSVSGGYSELLQTAAGLHGMDAGFWDIWGKWHETPEAARRAILESLGIPCGDENLLRNALYRSAIRQWSRPVNPVQVISVSEQPAAIDLHLPAGLSEDIIAVSVTLEDGTRLESDFPMAQVASEASVELGGEAYVLKRVRFPNTLPLGYHSLRIEHPRWVDAPSCRLIVCPDRAWLPDSLAGDGRRAGLAVSLYGIRDARDWGCGDFTTLLGVAEWVARDLKGSYVALNPLQAIHNRQPYNTSPYLPNSTLYRNFIYLDIDRIEEMQDSGWARALRAHPRIAVEIEALRHSEFVEYERVHKLKLRLLRALFRTFLVRHWSAGTPRAAAFRRYLEQEGSLLDDYALYTALDEHLHKRNPDAWIWQQWPEAFQDPSSPEVEEFKKRHWRSVLFYQYIQWQIDVQAAEVQHYALSLGMEIGLFHDLPLATDRCGFELWANRAFYVSGCRVGSPPDDFAPNGQDWSFPPPNTRRHEEDGYRLFAETIRKSARHGGALRLDHVMRLFRLYWIPDGFEATEGTYVKDNAEDLLRILALESVRARVVIVGEDLGTVEPSMRETFAQFGILSYRLLYFEKRPDGAFKLPGEYPVGALVSSTTHDLPTIAGFWQGRDIGLRRELGMLDEEGSRRWNNERVAEKEKLIEALIAAGLLPPSFDRAAARSTDLSGELHNAIIGFLVSTPSALMTLNHEDLTKEPDQQNLPGTTHEYPNWRRKMRFTVEELNRSPQARDFAAMFRHWLIRTGRARPDAEPA